MVPRVLEWTGLHLHRVTDLTQGVFCDALAMIYVYSYIHCDFFYWRSALVERIRETGAGDGVVMTAETGFRYLCHCCLDNECNCA